MSTLASLWNRHIVQTKNFLHPGKLHHLSKLVQAKLKFVRQYLKRNNGLKLSTPASEKLPLCRMFNFVVPLESDKFVQVCPPQCNICRILTNDKINDEL